MCMHSMMEVQDTELKSKKSRGIYKVVPELCNSLYSDFFTQIKNILQKIISFFNFLVFFEFNFVSRVY